MVSYYHSYLIIISYLPTILRFQLFLSNTINFKQIGIMVRVFANGPEDRGLNPGRVIPKSQIKGTRCFLTKHYVL